MLSVSLGLYLRVTAVTLRLQWHQLCIYMQYLYQKLLKIRGDLNTLIASCQEIGSQWIHCHSPGRFTSWSLSLGLAEPSARLGRLLPVLCLVPLWNTQISSGESPAAPACPLQLQRSCGQVSLGSKAASSSFNRGVCAQGGINCPVSLSCRAEGEHLYPQSFASCFRSRSPPQAVVEGAFFSELAVTAEKKFNPWQGLGFALPQGWGSTHFTCLKDFTGLMRCPSGH